MPGSSRSRRTSLSRSRSATTVTSSTCTTRTSATGAASSSRSSSTIPAGASSTWARRGAGRRAVVARGRRPAHAQGGRARGARDGDARSSGRAHLQVLQPLRDGRGLDARGRALPYPLLGPRAPQSLPRSVRDVSTLGASRGRRRARAPPLLLHRALLPGRRRRAHDRAARFLRERSPARECRFALRQLDGRGLRPRRPQLRQHVRSPARRSTTGRTVSSPPTIWTSSPPTSMHKGSTPMASSRARSFETSFASASRSAPSRPGSR